MGRWRKHGEAITIGKVIAAGCQMLDAEHPASDRWQSEREKFYEIDCSGDDEVGSSGLACDVLCLRGGGARCPARNQPARQTRFQGGSDSRGLTRRAAFADRREIPPER